MWKTENLLSLLGIEPQFLGHPVHSTVAIQTELYQSTRILGNFLASFKIIDTIDISGQIFLKVMFKTTLLLIFAISLKIFET
jgi:hypothetical protein